MKKIISFLCFIFVLCAATKAAAPELVDFKDLQGFDRQYYRYVPESYNAATPSGLIVCLHAFGRTGEDFFTQYGFQALADSMNIIVLAPNALPEQDAAVIKTMTDNVPQFPLNALWGCGLKMTVTVFDVPYNGTILTSWDIVNATFNAGVNDYAFINSIIGATKTSYNISTDNVFIIGLSMGGYMAYQYSLFYSNTLAGMISVNGTMGNLIQRKYFREKLPVCDFHSVDDEVVPYAGSYDIKVHYKVAVGDTVILKATVAMGNPKKDVISLWVGKNGDRTTPDSLVFDSIANKTTAVKLTYPNLTTGDDYVHYKMTGGTHAYSYSTANGDCLDLNTEFLNFITKHSTLIPTGIKSTKNIDLQIFQNTAKDFIQIMGIRAIQSATIIGMDGREIISFKGLANTVDISSLKPGLYFVKILADGKTTVKKFIKK